MSRARVQEVLEGFDGPFYPENIDDLNDVFASYNYCGSLLSETGKKIEGFKKLLHRQVTLGSNRVGYSWFWGLEFNFGGNKIVVLFPWVQDWNKTDGIQLDRSIAMFVEKSVLYFLPDFLINRMIAELLNVRQEVESQEIDASKVDHYHVT